MYVVRVFYLKGKGFIRSPNMEVKQLTQHGFAEGRYKENNKSE